MKMKMIFTLIVDIKKKKKTLNIMSILFNQQSNVIFNELNTIISNARDKKDLIALTLQLCNLNDLKNICKIKLKENYQSKKVMKIVKTQPIVNNKNSGLRSIYLNIAPINNILPTDLIVYIIKYQLSSDFPIYFILSKRFNQLMNNHPILFIDYSIFISSFLWENSVYFKLNHKRKTITLHGKSNQNTFHPLEKTCFPINNLYKLNFDLWTFELNNEELLKFQFLKTIISLNIKIMSLYKFSNFIHYLPNLVCLSLVIGTQYDFKINDLMKTMNKECKKLIILEIRLETIHTNQLTILVPNKLEFLNINSGFHSNNIILDLEQLNSQNLIFLQIKDVTVREIKWNTNSLHKIIFFNYINPLNFNSNLINNMNTQLLFYNFYSNIMHSTVNLNYTNLHNRKYCYGKVESLYNFNENMTSVYITNNNIKQSFYLKLLCIKYKTNYKLFLSKKEYLIKLYNKYKVQKMNWIFNFPKTN